MASEAGLRGRGSGVFTQGTSASRQGFIYINALSVQLRKRDGLWPPTELGVYRSRDRPLGHYVFGRGNLDCKVSKLPFSLREQGRLWE